MSSRLRNIVVGLTVLGAILILALGIYRFGSAPATFFKPPQINVVFDAARGDGLGDGSPISFLGVEAGRVTSVRREGAEIIIEAQLNKEPPIPANVYANIIFTSPLGGVSSLELRTDGPASSEPVKEGAKLKAMYLGSTFLPPEIAEAAREATRAIHDYNESKLLDQFKSTVAKTELQIVKAGEVMDSLKSLVADPQMQADLKKSLANIRESSENASVISGQLRQVADKFQGVATKSEKVVDTAQATLETTNKRIDEVGLELTNRLKQISAALDQLNAITAKLNEGKGTAGLLLNDPKLYQGLVDTTTKLNLTLDDVRRYVQQVEQEGLSFGKGGVFGK